MNRSPDQRRQKQSVPEPNGRDDESRATTHLSLVGVVCGDRVLTGCSFRAGNIDTGN